MFHLRERDCMNTKISNTWNLKDCYLAEGTNFQILKKQAELLQFFNPMLRTGES